MTIKILQCMGKLPNYQYIGKLFFLGGLMGNFKQYVLQLSSLDTDSKI